ncbi:glycosyltransferase [Alteripontixanthobacter maritimus]|uniref:glycosyltransferase n=1 Tax=Alteripontixanthobacter maritimus TaxID=2161824 RepID=UPI002DDBE5A7|nr:glycosyltransferase [Alteripontixanthobacter maritimus]
MLSLSTLYPNSTNPRFGTFVARSLEALAARNGWEVTCINPLGIPPIAFGKYRALKDAAVDGVENGVDVRRPTFPLIPRFGGRINPAIIARKVLPLAQELHAQTPFDILDAQFFYPDGPAIASIAKELGLPYSIKARGADISYWGKQDYGAEQMLDAASGAAGLLAVSQALADDMAGMGMRREAITVHYTGLDRDRFRPLDHVGLRRKLGQELGLSLPSTAPLLATVGALIPRKGQELVIGALADLTDAHLLLVGKGEDEHHLRRLAADMGAAGRVHFLGSVDHNLLPVILSAADLMVLPSASEGLANAWVESLACGTPLVITDAGGARELVMGPEAGTIVERDLSSVTQGIRHMLANLPSPRIVAAMAKRFSWEANAGALAQYYERLIDRHAG